MKVWVPRILIGLIGLAIGILIMVYRSPNPINSLEEEKEIVDSLQNKIDTLEVEKEVVKWKVEKVVEEKIVTIDSIKNLSPTDGIKYLNMRLHEMDN